ncbi:MAG: hypothetical protein QOI06_1490 [Nocardioidaceae bacterium]|jgi:hypothetical protein|nr:hypothetical protein [Nocardioidaceae bacterium]
MSGWFQAQPQPTYSQFQALLEEGDFLPKQKHHLEVLRSEYAEFIMGPVRWRYESEHERHVAELSAVLGEIGVLDEASRRMAVGLESGRIEAKAGRRDLTRVFADLQRVRARADALRESADASWARVNRSPEEIQEENLGRFPHLRDHLPLITDEIVAGREPSPYRPSSQEK